jgi:eukaryotic-like serine/threonine-protein kinase
MFHGLDASSLLPGAVLFKRYVVEEALGEGGVGIVVAARDRVLRRRVAIKCLRQVQPHSRALALRFLREARAMARLESAHTVRIFDARPGVLIMEYLHGVDVARLLKQHGRLTPREAVLLVLQACDALAEAHQLGIVHRDLKLENLFVTRRAGSESGKYIKVLDFGLSKVLSDHEQPTEGVTLTETQCVLGSVEFMSPEQSRSARDVDHRTDIWALGVILFMLLSGKNPFARRFVSEVRCAVLAGEIPDLRSLCDELPAGLEDVVARCLRVNRDERYDSIRSLARALLRYAGERRRSAYAFATQRDAESQPGEEAPSSSPIRSRIGQFFSPGKKGRAKAPFP